MSMQTQQLIIREMYMYDVKAVKFETAPHRNEVHLHQTRPAIDFGAVWD